MSRNVFEGIMLTWMSRIHPNVNTPSEKKGIDQSWIHITAWTLNKDYQEEAVSSLGIYTVLYVVPEIPTVRRL